MKGTTFGKSNDQPRPNYSKFYFPRITALLQTFKFSIFLLLNLA